jgi:rhodanese-related sulfurtransferase
MATVQTIQPTTLAAMMRQNPAIELLDVRTPAEYETRHALSARLEPLDRLNPAEVMASRGARSSEPLYLICKSGGRAGKACEAFMAAGFTNVISVAGGTEAWAGAGLPTESTGRKTLPLDRQIQLIAGMICLTGAILGVAVSPWFYLLCAMVGAGLTLAGLTGFCGMAVLLARMPWNQARSC